MPPPRVFISYSHDSIEHQDRVRALGDRLRADGVDAWIDQYSPAPPEGWPMWSERQIQDADFVLVVCTKNYRQRAECREEPVNGRGVLWESKIIYALLYRADAGVQRFIPVLFGGRGEDQDSCIPLALQGLQHYQIDTAAGYEDLYRHITNQPRHTAPALGKLRRLPAKDPVSFPASFGASPAAEPTTRERRSRQAVIARVRHDWIDGVLNQSLYKVARIELGLADRTDLVEQPNAVVQVPDRAPREIPAGVPIGRVFDDLDGSILILGAPGTGKTTLLLELARELLDRAVANDRHPIPVVFNLSSWAVRRQPLADWLISELNERVDVGRTLARKWMETEQILPLLDGLDEVAAAHRDACVEAINSFRRCEHGLLQIAVCARIADYEALGARLRLRNAVEVQPLTQPQICSYLERVGGPLDALRAALRDDPLIWELLETPLMLWVAMLAYRDVPYVPSSADTLEHRRRQLFAQFVEAMFRRRARRKPYSLAQTQRWLASLSRILTTTNQTIFYLESLDFTWLRTRAQQWLARVALVATGGLIGGVLGVLGFGLINWLIFQASGTVINLQPMEDIRLLNDTPSEGSQALRTTLVGVLRNGMIGGLIVGLIGGLVATLVKLKPVEKVGFRWADIGSQKTRAQRDAMIGLSAGLLYGLVTGWIAGLRKGLISGLRVGLVGGLSNGLILAVLVGFTRLFTSEANPETRSAVNEGTRRSVVMALAVGVIGGLAVGLIFGLTIGPGNRVLAWGVEVISGLIFFGSIIALFSGGMFVLKHVVLRVLLWTSGSAPLRYPAFLAHAKELLFLRQIGGGYIVVHRLLRDYFASLPAPGRLPSRGNGNITPR